MTQKNEEQEEEFEDEDGEEEDCPVEEEVCKARMSVLDSKFKYLFGSSLLTIALILVQLLRSH